ncbi:MAG: hypothetical protein AAGF26_12310, partial [Cyanobacteria bacterium P01_G01_bin.49]
GKSGYPIPDDTEENEISFIYLLLKSGWEREKDDDFGYVTLSMLYDGQKFQDKCNRFNSSVVHPFVGYIESYLTRLQIDIGDEQDTKIKVIIGDKYEVQSGGNMSVDNSQPKENIYTDGGEYRKIDTNGGRYVETRDNSQYIENYIESKNLVEAAEEIQKLLEQLEQTYSSKTTTGKMKIATEAIQCIENDSTLTQKIVSVLQAGSISALESLLNHPAASFLVAALEELIKK